MQGKIGGHLGFILNISDTLSAVSWLLKESTYYDLSPMVSDDWRNKTVCFISEQDIRKFLLGVLWAELCPLQPNSCGEALTPSTSDCDCIWREGL